MDQLANSEAIPVISEIPKDGVAKETAPLVDSHGSGDQETGLTSQSNEEYFHESSQPPSEPDQIDSKDWYHTLKEEVECEQEEEFKDTDATVMTETQDSCSSRDER